MNTDEAMMVKMEKRLWRKMINQFAVGIRNVMYSFKCQKYVYI